MEDKRYSICAPKRNIHEQPKKGGRGMKTKQPGGKLGKRNGQKEQQRQMKEDAKIEQDERALSELLRRKERKRVEKGKIEKKDGSSAVEEDEDIDTALFGSLKITDGTRKDSLHPAVLQPTPKSHTDEENEEGKDNSPASGFNSNGMARETDPASQSKSDSQSETKNAPQPESDSQSETTNASQPASKAPSGYGAYCLVM